MDSTNHPDPSRNTSPTPRSDNISSTEDEGPMALPTDSMQVRAEKLQERIRLALKRQKVAGKDTR